MNFGLTPRWYPLKPHAAQWKLWNSRARFIVNPAPRRSGKTELLKRKTVLRAISVNAAQIPDATFVLGAPTYNQAKRIFWRDVKAMSPPLAVRRVMEGELTIRYFNGAQVIVGGMDAPERFEGMPIDGVGLDEYGNMRESVWMDHIYPALGTPGRPPGWGWMTGVPEGRNHYWKLWRRALSQKNPEWEGHRWSAEGIVDPRILEQARRDMDERSYRQEWGGEFVDFAGRVYYEFFEEIHARESLHYDPSRPLIFCFDFNVEPGTASVIQELDYTGSNLRIGQRFTGVIDEVWIEVDSRTAMVCEELIRRYRNHPGMVWVYGDASGGARSTSQGDDGTDIAIIEKLLRPVFGRRLDMRFGSTNPSVKGRVNAVNARIMNADRIARFLVDPVKAPHVVQDFEGVRIKRKKDGSTGSFEIDKEHDPMLTHLSDGIGYYIHEEFPVFEPEDDISVQFY